MSNPPPAVVLHIWTIAPRHIPRGLALLARQRRDVRALPFGKLLGTGSGETFAVRDADLTRYALITSWPQAHAPAIFERGPIVGAWQRIAEGRRRIELVPVRSRGTWSGRAPFGVPDDSGGPGPVAVLTHARIRASHLRAFWRATPAVATDLAARPGNSFRLAFGEAPLGVQGTFSIWDDITAMTAFARDSIHRDVVRRRIDERWYAEEIFARFRVVSDESWT